MADPAPKPTAPPAETGGPAAPTENAGTPAAKAGTPAANAGKPGANAGKPGANAGKPGANAGTPAAKSGKPGTNAGKPGAANSKAPPPEDPSITKFKGLLKELVTLIDKKADCASLKKPTTNLVTAGEMNVKNARSKGSIKNIDLEPFAKEIKDKVIPYVTEACKKPKLNNTTKVTPTAPPIEPEGESVPAKTGEEAAAVPAKTGEDAAASASVDEEPEAPKPGEANAAAAKSGGGRRKRKTRKQRKSNRKPKSRRRM